MSLRADIVFLVSPTQGFTSSKPHGVKALKSCRTETHSGEVRAALPLTFIYLSLSFRRQFHALRFLTATCRCPHLIDYGPGRRRRFSYDQAADIMREFNAGGTNAHALSLRYNIDSGAMRKMLAGETYSDVWLTVQREREQSIVEWAEPPPAKNPGPKNTPRETLANLISLLKAHPGRWAWVKTVKNKPNLTWWQQRGLEAQMRKIEGGWRVYARWPEEEPFLS